MIARVVKTLQRPFYRFLLQTTRGSTWQRYPCKVPLHVYGAGSRCQFSWYLEGQTDSAAMEIESMKAWLAECEYVTDDLLFDEPDFWQHPVSFERLCRGDCEDFSLWTWRKLLETGYRAEFVAGWSVHPGEEYRGHTWVLYKDQGNTYVFDAVVRDPARMVLPLSEVADWYVPQVSVDERLKQYVYGGYYSQLKPSWLAATL